VTHQPLRLAKCLARVAEWVTPSSRVLLPAMVEAPGSPLVQRVRRLTAPDEGPAAGARLGLAAPVLLAGVAAAMVALAPAVSVGQRHDVVRSGDPVMRALADGGRLAFLMKEGGLYDVVVRDTLWFGKPLN
jgi:hypothetical protein